MTPFGAELAGSTPTSRKQANEAAVKCLTLPATAAHRQTLMAYSGLGGVGVSKDQYYTPSSIVLFMWRLLALAGFKGGKVLEPACGTGAFMNGAPAAADLTGVELDKTAAQIADRLWGDRHIIQHMSFEQFALTALAANLRFDAIIGNAPFGIRATLGEDKARRNLIKHELYFLARGLDLLQPGGVMALIVPASVNDAPALKPFRQALLTQAECLGVFRLSAEAFKASGAAVVTDVLLFRKGRAPVPTPADLAFLEGTAPSGPACVGSPTLNRWGQPSTGGPITPDMLDAAIKSFQPQTRALPALRLVAVPQPEPVIPQAAADPVLLAAESAGQAIIDLMAAQRTGSAEAERLAARDALQTFTHAHGNPHACPSLKAHARSRTISALLAAVSPSGDWAQALQTRTHHTQAPQQAPVSIPEAIAQALQTSLDGSFDPATLGTPEAVIPFLITDPELIPVPESWDGAHFGRYTTLTRYASGPIYDRLDALEALPALALPAQQRDQIRTALKAQIRITPLEQAHVSLRDRWIPDAVKNEFLALEDSLETSLYQQYGDLTWQADSGVYVIKPRRLEEWMSEGWQSSKAEQLQLYLNHMGLGGRDDDKQRRLEAMAELETHFKEWLLTCPHKASLEAAYNRAFNGYVQPVYSDAPMQIPGFNFPLHGYQYQGIRKLLAQGCGISALDVGLGKTFEAIALNLKLKAEGLAKKPAIVVPKSVLVNWKREIDRATTGLKVLYIGENFKLDKNGQLKSSTMTTTQRELAFKQAALEDWDLILITSPAFQALPLSPEQMESYADEQFYQDTYGRKLTDYQRAKAQDSHAAKTAMRQFLNISDQTFFDDLGIDALTADEAHEYKNLRGSRQNARIRYLPSGDGSKRAYDFQSKCRYLQAGGRAGRIFMLTATPTKNSPLEVYAMIGHLAPQEWTQRGIMNLEHFIDVFGDVQQRTLMTATGDYVDASALVGFQNVNSLRDILYRYTDLRNAAEVGLELPTAEDQILLSDIDDRQAQDYTGLRVRAVTMQQENGETDHLFRIMHEMEVASFAPQLRAPLSYPGGYFSPKMRQACQLAVNEHKRTGGGQLMFTSDLFVASHELIQECLISCGANPLEIGIANGQTCPKAIDRQRLADKFNRGELRYLIGNDAIIGQGLNLQEDTATIHHMTLPWTPADIQQRNGRGVRQGNLRDAVGVFYYFAKSTFDGLRHQALSRKADWIGDLWRGKADSYINEDANPRGGLEPGELQILLSPDPEEARKRWDANKSLALEAYEQKKKLALYREFDRLKKNLTRLRNLPEGSPAHIGLAHRIEEIRTRLQQAPAFTHKHLLEDDGYYSRFKDVLIVDELQRVYVEGDLVKARVNVRRKNEQGMHSQLLYFRVQDIYPRSRSMYLTPISKDGINRISFNMTMIRQASPEVVHLDSDRLLALREEQAGIERVIVS